MKGVRAPEGTSVNTENYRVSIKDYEGKNIYNKSGRRSRFRYFLLSVSFIQPPARVLLDFTEKFSWIRPFRKRPPGVEWRETDRERHPEDILWNIIQ